jgi:hypothetical protein
MIIANILNQVLGTLCTGLFTVILAISVAAVMGVRFLKQNAGAQQAVKAIARTVVLRGARRWLKF